MSSEEFRENQRVLAWALVTIAFVTIPVGIVFAGGIAHVQRGDWVFLASLSFVAAIGGA